MNKKVIAFFVAWKETIVSLLIAGICLSLFFLFPANGAIQDFTRTFFFLGLIPALYISVILKKKLRYFGLNFSVDERKVAWFFAMFLVSLLITWILIHYAPFKNAYIIPDYAIVSFKWFLLYELVFINIWFFFFEAFFKGFLLFTLTEKFGIWSVPLSALFFALYILIAKSFSWGNASVMLLTLTGGLLAYKTRSFIYSYLMGLLYIIIIDAYMIYVFKQFI